MPGESSEIEKDESGYSFQRGRNWTHENVRTIIQWIHISSINLDIATESARHYKILLRRNTVMNLLLSSFASTASLSQFNINQTSQPSLYLALNILFTICACLIALGTGFIKIYQVQEKLEKSIKLHQEWTSFGSMLSSELQLPLALRKDALYMIIKYKDSYTELFKQQSDVSRKILARVAKRNGVEPHELSLSELFERLIETEAKRLRDTEESIVIAINAPCEASSETCSETPQGLTIEETTQVDDESVISETSTVKSDIPQPLQTVIKNFGSRLKLHTRPMRNSQLQAKRENMSKLVLRQSQSQSQSQPRVTQSPHIGQQLKPTESLAK